MTVFDIDKFANIKITQIFLKMITNVKLTKMTKIGEIGEFFAGR